MYIQSKFEDIDFYFCTPLGAVWSGGDMPGQYSRVLNKRRVWNKRRGGKIWKKTINIGSGIIVGAGKILYM